MPKITPQNVDEFMRGNVVTTPTNINNATDIPYADPAKKLVWAHLISGFPAVLTNGTGGDVFRIEFLTASQAADDDEAFLIYWVEYEANGQGTATWLGNDAQLMFTATMSGCSFGLGSYTKGGVRAAHVNSATACLTGSPDSSQKQHQHQKLVNLGDLVVKEITIDEYMPGTFDPQVKTTPFGYRPQLSGGKVPNRRVKGGISNPQTMSLPWKFCWLKYKAQGKQITHLGLQQHGGGIF